MKRSCLTFLFAIAFGMTMAQEQISVEKSSTIDQELTQECKALMTATANKCHFEDVQTIVMDAGGELKAWVALKRQGESLSEYEPDYGCCSKVLLKPIYAIVGLSLSKHTLADIVDTKEGVDSIDGIIIRDHNWRKGGYGQITYKQAIGLHSNIGMYHAIRNGFGSENAKSEWGPSEDGKRLKEVNPLIVCATYNGIANNGVMRIPNPETGEVVETGERLPAASLAMLQLALSRPGSTLHRWVENSVDWVCYATTDKGEDDYQLHFAGYFPLDDPQYCICVVAYKKTLPANTRQLSEIVNPLAKWLQQHPRTDVIEKTE